MHLLEDKAIVVTGAGRGLGAAYARHAASEGAKVVVNDIDAALAADVVQSIVDAGGTAVLCSESVTTWAGAAAIIGTCVERFGRIDGLVNNAGIMPTAEPWTHEEGELRRVVDVNLVGALYCGTHAMKHMVPRRSGVIVNVTSGAQMGRAMMSAYGATRAATAALTYGWALDCRPHGVRVNAIWPTARTEISAGYRNTPTAKARGEIPFTTPEANAPLMTYLLSDRSSPMTGQVVVLRGGRLGLVSHPRITEHVLFRAEGWSVDDIADAFASTLNAGLQPVGAPD
jgi:NAD(P)-dependent dehydrogenase (short-subunit alcohol dehydrogenase family)